MRRTIIKDAYKNIGFEISMFKYERSFSDLGRGRGPYNHTFYIKIPLQMFPSLPMPELKARDYVAGGKAYEYYDHPLSELDFHGGITYMSVIKYLDSGISIIDVGCDYQHYGDDHYSFSDHSESIIEDAKRVIDQLFEKFPPISAEEFKVKLNGKTEKERWDEEFNEWCSINATLYKKDIFDKDDNVLFDIEALRATFFAGKASDRINR